jgi:bacillaene synthase trans-acting acyltransferase
VRRPTVFLFSGQGSQYFQMGRGLYDANAIFRGWMNRLDEMVRQSSGRSVVEALYAETHRKGEPFERTLLTHPAIFMIEVSLAHSLVDAGVAPDMLLGASLGSFAAAVIGGAMDVEDGLRAVVHQAIAFEESCQAGGMIAILADPALFAEPFLGMHSELAGVNFASHFVISAMQSDLASIEAELKSRNIGHQRLPVSFAFHSQWMDRARAPFGAFMQSIPRRAGSLPIVCCDQAAVVSDLSGEYFWNVVRRPLRFRETISRLESEGPHRYIDVGPAGTLATFLKYGLAPGSRSAVHPIMTPFGTDQKNLTSLLAALAN